MKKRLEAKPTILQLIRTWFSSGVLLMAASLLVAVPAEPVFAAERYVYAKVFIDGIGTEHGYGYMRDVYLDVVAIPSDAVVHQDSGILFTDQNYKKSLSPIQVSALEFVKPHLKDLGFKKVSDYQVFIYPADKKDPIRSKLDAVQKKRDESLAIPSKLTGEKAELHGIWTQVQEASAEAKPPSAEAKSASSEVKTPAPDVKSAPSKAADVPVKPVETAKAPISPEQQKLKQEEDAADAKAKAKARAKKKKEKEEARKEEARKKALAAAKTQDDMAQPKEKSEEVIDNKDDEREAREERKRKRELERELKTEMAMEKQKEMTMEREREAEKKARTRAKGKVVKEMVYSDDLKEQQAKSWCKRVVPEFLKSVAAENNTLINVGGCSCKPQGEPGSLVFKCQFPATYRRASAADTLTQ